MEKDADAALKKGEVYGPYNNAEEAIQALDNEEI